MPDEIIITADMKTDSIQPIEHRISIVLECMTTGKSDELPEVISQWSAGDTAAVLEALPQSVRPDFWELIPDGVRGEVLAWLGEQVRKRLLSKLDADDIVAAASDMDTQDLADMVDEVPTKVRMAIFESLSMDERADVEDTLGYPENTAGRLMERDWIAVHADAQLKEVKQKLYKRGSLPRRTTALMVVDREGVFQGKLMLEELLTRDPELRVADVMDDSAVAVNVLTPQSEVASLFERRDLVYLPVVDDNRHLQGRIIIDNAIHLIRTEAEQPMMHMAGLEVDEDLLAPIAASAQRRLFWLGVNLMTAFLAAWVIGLFEATIDKIVALAVLMPIVASMGGIAGSQTLTLAIRGLALGQITSANTRWLAIKEISISVINGIVWAIVVGLIAWIWFDHIGIALILAAAMVINLLFAAISGLVIPLFFNRIGLDPALSGSVVLTTVTDIIGFMSFLGMATIFLL